MRLAVLAPPLLLALAACRSPSHPISATGTAPPIEAGPAPLATEPVAPSAPPAAATGATTGGAVDRGDACATDAECRQGLECVRYFGIAGRAGGEMGSCETPCADGAGTCPEGLECVTIADGPGAVCRPARN